MKDFEKTKRFAQDINFLSRAICSNEFYNDGYFYDRAMEIYRKYIWTEENNAYDVKELITEYLDSVEVQSLDGMQNAFDIWKTILNGITLPDCDLCNYAEATKEEKHNEDGIGILEMAVDLCGCLRREVEQLMDDYHLQNNSQTTHFLTPQYYEIGDVGCNATDDKKSREKAQKQPKRTFRDIIQHPDPDEVLKRLHYLIDDKSGKAVGIVIRKAWLDKLTKVSQVF